LASLESGRAILHPTEFEVTALLAECLQVLQMKASEKEIQLVLDAPDDLPELQADRGKIKQVLLNLINNAVKYNRPQGEVRLIARMKKEMLLLAVKDTGVGIPADQIAQLFTRFFRARNVEQTTPGTGLGLSISRRIVEMHGGAILVESELGVGTTFSIELPLKQEE
jgi:signal transduction histidine kinase